MKFQILTISIFMRSNKKSWVLRWLTTFQRYTKLAANPLNLHIHYSKLFSVDRASIQISRYGPVMSSNSRTPIRASISSIRRKADSLSPLMISVYMKIPASLISSIVIVSPGSSSRLNIHRNLLTSANYVEFNSRRLCYWW